MTIVISPGAASALAATGTENNPLINWRNRTDGATFTTPTGTEIESADFLETSTTYDKWVVEYSGSGLARAQIVLASDSRVIDTVCIAAHTISDEGASIAIDTSIDSGSSWQDCGAGTVTPTDNKAICFLFNEAPTTDYWRIRLLGGTVAAEVSIGVAFFGRSLQVSQRIYQGYTPPITPTRVDLQSDVSAGANLLGASVVRKGSNAVANLTHLKPSFIRATGSNDWFPFQSYFNNGGGAFWMWRPTKYGDAFYGWRDGDPIIPTNSGPKDFMSASIAMRLFDDS